MDSESGSVPGLRGIDCLSLVKRLCLQFLKGTAATAGAFASCCGGGLVNRLRPARSSWRGSYVKRSWRRRGAVLPMVLNQHMQAATVGETKVPGAMVV